MGRGTAPSLPPLSSSLNTPSLPGQPKPEEGQQEARAKCDQREWSLQLEPPRPCPGMEAGGAVAPGLQSEGADTDPRTPRPSPAAPHRAAASAQLGPASCSRGRCHPLELSLSPLPPPTQLPPPPRRCSSCSGLLPPPLPRPPCPRAEPIPARRLGLCAQSPQSSRPPYCPAPGVIH